MITDLITLDRTLVSLDLETTGVNPKIDRIIQIGVVRIDPDGTVSEGMQLVNPGVPIPPEATAIHGITNEMVANEPPFKEIAPSLHAGLQASDLCGYNIAFDVGFLTHEFNRTGLTFKTNRIVDSYRIFTKFSSRTLVAAVGHYLNEDHSNAHDALDDARAALRVFRAQLERHPELPRSVGKIHDFLFNTIVPGNIDASGKLKWKNGQASIAFGRWSGTLLKDVPRGYLKWMVEDGDFTAEVKAIVQEAREGRFPEKKND